MPAQATTAPTPALPLLAANLIVAAIYFALARFGLNFVTIGDHISPVWPPSGLSIAALLLYGTGLAPGVFVGSFIANLAVPSPLPIALTIALGNTLEPLAALWLFAHGRRYPTSLDRLSEVFRFFALAAFVPAVISALVGVTSLSLAQLSPWSAYPNALKTWALGNFLGTLVGSPVLLAAARPRSQSWTAPRLAEAAAMLAGLAIVSYLVFVRGWEDPYTDAPLVFTPFPFLIWAALRFGPPGAAYTNLLIATIATIATAQEKGPFATGSYIDNVWLLQMFIAVTTAATLIIAATVAERQQAEAAHRNSEAQLQLALNAARMGIWTWDIPSGKITWTDGIARLFGIPLADFDGTYESYLRFIHPDDREKLALKVKRSLDYREPYEIEHRLIRPDGSIRWLQGVGDVFRDPAGKPLRMSGVALDITARREAEKLNERLGRILDTSLNEIYVFDADTLHFLSVNQGARKNLGYSLDELKQLTPLDLKVTSSRETFRQLTAPLYEATENLVTFDSTHHRKDGSTYPVEVRLLLSRAESPPVFVAVIQDTTHRQRTEQERLQLERRLQESQKLESLGILAGGIAHDFNNLLTGILGNLSLARMGIQKGADPNRQLDQAEATALHAADLCKQMLAYSGKGRFVLKRIDLSAFVEDSAPLLHLSISKKATLNLHLANSLPPVNADATQMQQILMNLVINASDAIGDRTGRIDITTGFMYADSAFLRATHLAPELPAGDYVYLEVSDNGSGMSPETLARIFDPFFTTKFTGRGLGLAAVLGIVRGHQGALKVSSEPGRGTSFRLLLPRTTGTAEEIRPTPPSPNDWQGSGTILVVDDEPSIRTVCARLVESFGFQSIEAADGREALEHYSRSPDQFALVLLDLTMPKMDGAETFREIRRLKPDARVLLMSGFSEQEVSTRFSSSNLDGFLQKPFKPDQLRSKIRAIVQSTSHRPTTSR